MMEIELDTLTENRPVSGNPPGFRSVLRGAIRPDLLRDELLAEIFAASTAFAPHAVAMMTMERKLTYAEVDHEALALARGLIGAELAPAMSSACGGREARNC